MFRAFISLDVILTGFKSGKCHSFVRVCGRVFYWELFLPRLRLNGGNSDSIDNIFGFTAA